MGSSYSKKSFKPLKLRFFVYFNSEFVTRNPKHCNLGPFDLWSQNIQWGVLHTTVLNVVLTLLKVLVLHLEINEFATLFSPDKKVIVSSSG